MPPQKAAVAVFYHAHFLWAGRKSSHYRVIKKELLLWRVEVEQIFVVVIIVGVVFGKAELTILLIVARHFEFNF